MGDNGKCKMDWCQEPIETHRLCGIAIDPYQWHKIWSADGRSLKPSDGWPYVRWPAHYAKGYSKKNNRNSLTA